MNVKRNTAPQPRKRSLLIQCEGQETEPNYLDELCKACSVRQRQQVKIKRGKGGNITTVEAAIAEGESRLLGENKYDTVWCVLDVEYQPHEATLTKAIDLAKKHGIRLFLSNPSFEVWLIAHFGRTTRDFTDSGAAEAHLNTHWRKRFGCDYDKGDPNLYAKLEDRVSDALENAQWMLEVFHENAPCRNANATTEVYQLVQELLNT